MKKLLFVFAALMLIMGSNQTYAANNTTQANDEAQASPISGTFDYDTTGDFPFSHYQITLEKSGKITMKYTAVSNGKETVREGTYTTNGSAKGSSFRIDYNLTQIKKGDAWIPSSLYGTFTMTLNRASGKATVTPNRGNELGIGIGRSRTLDFK